MVVKEAVINLIKISLQKLSLKDLVFVFFYLFNENYQIKICAKI